MATGCPAPVNKYTAEMLHLRLREHHRRGDKKNYKNQKNRKSAIRLWLLEIAGKLHKKYGCLNKAWRRTSSIDILTSKGEISWGLIPRQRTKNNRDAESRRNKRDEIIIGY